METEATAGVGPDRGRRRSPQWSYFLAALVTVLAMLLRWLLAPVLGAAGPYQVFLISVVLSAIGWGLGPGLLATLLGALLGTWLFVEPYGRLALNHLHLDDTVRLILFMSVGTVISLMSGRLHALRRRNEQQRELRAVRDTTQRKRAEQQLHENELRFRALVTACSDVVFCMSPDWSEMRQLLGRDVLPDMQTPGRTWLQRYLPPEDQPPLMAAIHQAIGTKSMLELEHRVIRIDGSPGWALSRAIPILDSSGEIAEWFGAAGDITRRKEAEEALRAAQEQLQKIADTMAAGVTRCSRDVRYLWVSRAYAQWLGRPAEQIAGRPLVQVLGQAGYENVRPYVQRVLRGEPVEYEAEVDFPGLGRRWINARYAPTHDAAGRVDGWVGVVTDISDRKAAEAELAAAKVAAEQANAAKDHFLAVLSHELRTPLAPVLPMLGELAGCVPEAWREDVEMARRNVELEARLIDDLLDVTRIARGKIELHREPVALEMVLRRAAEVCAPDLEARGLHFAIQVEGGPHPLDADPARLQQVFWNLIKNAIKFTPKGGCVGIHCRSDGDGHVLAQVKDSGMGIEPTALARIFNAFEQVDRSVTRQFGGLGLGLAICRASVELHGGTIHAHSEGKGKGATFTVKLPIHKVPAGGLPNPEPGYPSVSPQGLTPARPQHILLVEDHGDTARIMRRMLQARGHQVETAGDVATALALAQERSFNVLVSDLGLPDRSGLELMQELRRIGQAIPGIALSGYGQDEDIHRSKAAGFAEHLVKPVNFAQLQAAIRRVAEAQACP